MCDSQSSALPPTRLLQLQQQGLCPKSQPGTYRGLAASTSSAEGATEGKLDTDQQEGHEQGVKQSCAVATAAAGASHRSSLRCSAAQAVYESTQSGAISVSDDVTLGLSTGAGTRGADRHAGAQPEAAACHAQAAHETRRNSCISNAESTVAEQDTAKDGEKRLRELELEHVHRVYEAIAPHFSATRCVFECIGTA